MRPTRSLSYLAVFCFIAALAVARPMCGDELPVSEEEKREQVASQRFLDLLLQRPTTGTALDRVFGHHVARGELGELLDRLGAKAEQAARDGEEQTAGNHWMVIGLLQLQRGEEASAAKALATAEAALKDNPLVAYHHGQALLLVGDDEAAAAAMQRSIDMKPSRLDFLTIAAQLGRIYQRAGKVEAAVGIWEQLEESFPGDDGVRQRIARALAEEGDAEGALRRYDALAMDARSENDRIVFALRAADLRVQLGRKDQATKDLETLLDRLRPGSYLYAEARRRIENAFLASGDYAGLAEYYEAWISEHSDDVGAVLRLARILSVQGRGPEATKWLEQVIERSPTDREPRLALIDTYIADERYADAATQYEELAAMEPKNPDHLVRWGQVLLEDSKRPKEQRKAAAAQVWKRLATERAGDAAIQSQVADLLRGAELTEEALAGYRTAIELAPAEPQYKEYLGEYLHRLDRHEESLPVWRSLADGDLRTRENLVRLAEVLHQFDEPQEALETLGRACELDPTIDERLRYAELLRKEGRFEDALEQLGLAREQTDSVDDRDRLFVSAVATYQAAGQLEERIEEARRAADNAKTDGELWRRLAVLHDANRESRESLEAIEKAVEHSGKSVETLDVAARMYESAGRLQEAVEKRKLLADTDQRFRSGHLQRLSSLYMRMGQSDEAIAAGKELLSAGGGTVDSFRFYADLCGQIGRTDERLDTLRRCLRMNPRSQDAQEMLGTQLAEDFKTDQAIELYWRMLDSASQLEDRRRVVTRLADLYLRSNRLDQLVSRLEIRGRESGDRRTTIDLVATAHQQAGDLGLARDALEGLLREQGRDTLLLERLVLLAELAGEVDAAVELQRQLLRLAPSRQIEAKLASLLLDIGAIDEAEALWLRLSKGAADSEQVSRNLGRLFASGENAMAARLAEQFLEDTPDDWEIRLQLMILQASEGEWKVAAETAQQLRAMDVPESTLPAGGKPYPSMMGSFGGAMIKMPPMELYRVQRLYEVQRVLDERYSSSRPATSLPKPIDFGHAKVMASWVLMKHELAEGNLASITEAAATKANREGATLKDVWGWYETAMIASAVDHTQAVSFQRPETWKPHWRLCEVDEELGALVLTQMFSTRSQFSQRDDVNVTISPLPEEKLNWLKEMMSGGLSERSDVSPYGAGSLLAYGASELRIAGREDEAEAFFLQHLDATLKAKDVTLAMTLASHVAAYGDDDQLWSLLELMLANPQNATINPGYGYAMTARCLSLFTLQARIDKGLTNGPEDAVYRDRVMGLVDAMVAEEAVKPMRRSSFSLSSVGGSRETHVMQGNVYHRVEIPFPPKGVGPDDSFITVLWSANTLMADRTDEWVERLLVEDEDQDSRHRILRKIVAGSILQWNDQTDLAMAQLAEAVELAELDASHYETQLRLMWADLLLRQGRKSQALKVIDAIAVYDQGTMAIREFAAAKLSAALGDRSRAQAAAKRLFGVRLDTGTQIELANLMRSLGMGELASDLVRRMRSRGGSNTEQLHALMTYFVAQDEKDQAAGVAMELLRRTVPTRRQSSRSMTSTEALRRAALQTLSGVGRLTSLIETTEQRLERSPKSQRIRGELGEMYTAAGNATKAQELLLDSLDGDTRSLLALETTAKQLVAAGEAEKACDAYLKVLRRKPDLFGREYYDIKRPFEQAKRLGDLADLVAEVGVGRFEAHRVGELCGDIVRDKDSLPQARSLFSAMLDTPPTGTNSMYSINRVLGYSGDLLDEELLAKTMEYLAAGSLQNKESWSNLFNGYSTGSDGRHKNGTTGLVKAVEEDDEKAAAMEDIIRKTLKEDDDWQEGRAWLALVLTVRKKYDEAKELLEPLLEEEMKPAPGYEVFWLIGSLIDEYPPMKSLAMKMYRYSMDKHAATINERGSEFKYTMANRLCQLLKEEGKNEEARDLVMQAFASREESTSSAYSSRADYEAYRKIREVISNIEFLAELGFPADALRMCRNFDMSLFDKAGRYERGQRDEFEEQRDALLEEVRELGGLMIAETMIDPQTSGPNAVDLAITAGERPFTSAGIQSLWVEVLERAATEPDQAKNLDSILVDLKALRETRPEDDSVELAYAIAADITGSPSTLRELISDWVMLSDWESVENPRLRRRFLVIATLRLDHAPGEESRRLIDEVAFRNADDWTQEVGLPLLAELGRRAAERKDTAAAERYWEAVLTGEGTSSQLNLLDLAQAAIEVDLPELSCAAAGAASVASDEVISSTELVTSVGSLGSLLGAKRSTRSVQPTNSDEQDPAEVRLARRLLELDDAWHAKKADSEDACSALMAIVFGENGSSVRPLCTPVEVGKNDALIMDSVFDRLALRAVDTKRTGEILSRLDGEDPSSHLLAGLTLLRGKKNQEARKHYAEVDGAALSELPKEAVLQALLPAVKNTVCSGEAIRIGLAFIMANKPTDRYEDIEPFDSFASVLAQAAFRAGHKEAGLSAINEYLELTQHDNARYTGDSGVRRRTDQLTNACRLLRNQHLDEALRFAAMRQSYYEMGYDRTNDWVSTSLMRDIHDMEDREQAYTLLADWTFEGDGPLRVLYALDTWLQRPVWLPQEMVDTYPSSIPTGSDSFPISTSWLILAKLAEEGATTEDLLGRLRQARQSERSGAAAALAITLSRLEQPVPADLLEEITHRMKSIAPIDGKPKTSLPMPTMQLATMLARNPEHAQWARQTAESFAPHGRESGRSYVMPSLYRFQYEQGWLERGQLKSAGSLVNWIASITAGAGSYAKAATPAIWLTDGQSQLTHLCGLSNDQMWFRYPLEGDFEFHSEFLGGDSHDMAIVADGVRFSPLADGSYVDVVTDGLTDWVRYSTELVKVGEWNQHTVRFQGDLMTYLLNGKTIYQEPRRNSSPWLAFQSPGQRDTQSRGIRITGKPVIPRSVDLLVSDDMRTWSGRYYGESLPTIQINEKVHESDITSRRYRTAARASRLSSLAWTVKDGELISGKTTKLGPMSQSVIRYDRPLGEGETLSYDFFFEADKLAVHPSVCRTAYVLRPDGLRLHWMTKNGDTTKIPHDYEVFVHPDNPAELPLKEGAWNHVTLQLEGSTLRIHLNDVPIFDQPIDILPQGPLFGFFHYADKTDVRIRNITLSGPWRDTLPERLLESSVD